MVKLYDGSYRLTYVGKSGICYHKRFKVWSKCYNEFLYLKKLPHVRYVIIVELNENFEFVGIRDEYCAKVQS